MHSLYSPQTRISSTQFNAAGTAGLGRQAGARRCSMPRPHTALACTLSTTSSLALSTQNGSCNPSLCSQLRYLAMLLHGRLLLVSTVAPCRLLGTTRTLKRSCCCTKLADLVQCSMRQSMQCSPPIEAQCCQLAICHPVPYTGSAADANWSRTTCH